jgi:hypothetical protein
MSETNHTPVYENGEHTMVTEIKKSSLGYHITIGDYIFVQRTPQQVFPDDPLNDGETVILSLCETHLALTQQVRLLREALEIAKKALTHDVPYSCWATGPLTGDPINDLVICPGCSAIKEIDSALEARELIKGG